MSLSLYLWLLLALAILAALCALMHLVRVIRRDSLDQKTILAPEADADRLNALVELRRADRPVFIVKMLWPHKMSKEVEPTNGGEGGDA